MVVLTELFKNTAILNCNINNVLLNTQNHDNIEIRDKI